MSLSDFIVPSLRADLAFPYKNVKPERRLKSSRKVNTTDGCRLEEVAGSKSDKRGDGGGDMVTRKRIQFHCY